MLVPTQPIGRAKTPTTGRVLDCFGVLGMSALTLGFWATTPMGRTIAVSTLGREPRQLAMQLASSVLVVACPCALGLALPTATLVGTGHGAARLGLVVRGGDALQAASEVRTVAFDKTGTLTRGMPEVARVLTCAPPRTVEDVLRVASAAEASSAHPIARAVRAAALPARRPGPVALRGVDGAPRPVVFKDALASEPTPQMIAAKKVDVAKKELAAKAASACCVPFHQPL